MGAKVVVGWVVVARAAAEGAVEPMAEVRLAALMAAAMAVALVAAMGVVATGGAVRQEAQRAVTVLLRV